MNKMQQQSPQTMNSAPSTPPLHLVSTEQIQKYLDENKNLIMAILENQNLGKMAECAQYQAILQRNLMYLAAIADAQPPGSGSSSQLPTSSVTPQGNPQALQQSQASIMQQQQQQQQQANVPMPNLPFQQSALRPQDQKNQLLQFQQQQQAHFGGGPHNSGGLHQLMQQGHGNNLVGGSQAGTLEAHPGHRQGNSGLGHGEGRD